MAVAVVVVACSEDEGAPVTPSFPEEEQIHLSEGRRVC